jgi:hypothetical protein
MADRYYCSEKGSQNGWDNLVRGPCLEQKISKFFGEIFGEIFSEKFGSIPLYRLLFYANFLVE